MLTFTQFLWTSKRLCGFFSPVTWKSKIVSSYPIKNREQPQNKPPIQRIIPTESISERYILILYIREQNIHNRILLVWFMYECSGWFGSLGHVGLELRLSHPGWFSNLVRNFTLGCTHTPFAAPHRTVHFPPSTATTRGRRSCWKCKVWFCCVTLTGLLSNVWRQAWFTGIELFMSVTGGLALVTLP